MSNVISYHRRIESALENGDAGRAIELRSALQDEEPPIDELLAEFFVEFLTPSPPYDDWGRGYLDKPIVLDIFSGSNITGKIAEDLGRYWLAFEKDKEYLEASEVRFLTAMEVERKFNDTQLGLEEFEEETDSSPEP